MSTDFVAKASPLNEQEIQLNLLRDSAADFVRRNTDFKKYRARREKLPGFDRAHVQQMAEMGWFGLLVPELHGGLGLGLTELAVVAQELGKGLLAEPVLATTALAGRVLVRARSSAIRDKLLRELVDANILPVLAWQEGLGGLDLKEISTKADSQRIGASASAGGPVQGVQISGRKRLVLGAAGASGFLVTASSAPGLGLYWIPSNASGLSISYEWAADGTPVGALTLDSVFVPNEDVVSEAGVATLENIGQAIDEAAVLACAEMLGVMEASLQMALSYLRTRVQFGKPIGTFQALQHKTTDLYVQQELSRAVLAEALTVLGRPVTPHVERSLMASRCKSRCSDAALRITREVIQLHGAIGFTDEYDAGLYLKRALVLSAWLGNASTHRRRFAALSTEPLGA
jgi:alkylation response protein AidB-like acyl-CoA dehydrogenase